MLETGEVVETHRAPGHVALDAPAIVSGVLSVSAVHAERRVRDAVARAADTSAAPTGLGGLHAAMAAGVLDAYRAQVVAFELEEVPADVTEAVVAAVAGYFDTEDGSHLRRRVRRVLARISPDLLRRRAVRARSQCRLERWVDEPGVDTWHGTFPSEEACAAWAAIDALAQQYVTDGVCQRVDRARAKALTDLVTGHATIEVQLTLTTPATPAATATATTAAKTSATDLVQVHGARAGEPVLVERGWLERAVPVTGRGCDPVSGALVDPDDRLGTDAYRPGRALAALVGARDARCRFPGCSVAARFCDLDHVTPWPAGPTTAANLACLCRRHHRVKQRPGWTVRIATDATITWTDPTGATRTTHPLDHRPLTLPDTGTDTPPPTPGTPSLVHPDGPHSTLEFTLEHHLGPPRPRPSPPCRVEVRHPTGRPVDRIPVHLDPHPGRRWPTPTRPSDAPPF